MQWDGDVASVYGQNDEEISRSSIYYSVRLEADGKAHVVNFPVGNWRGGISDGACFEAGEGTYTGDATWIPASQFIIEVHYGPNVAHFGNASIASQDWEKIQFNGCKTGGRSGFWQLLYVCGEAVEPSDLNESCDGVRQEPAVAE